MAIPPACSAGKNLTTFNPLFTAWATSEGEIHPGNTGNLKDYLSCDKILCCGGSWMVKGDMIRNGEFDKIQVMVKEAKELADEIRFN